jgi:energy-converting hydrogenase Eha subunit C
MSWDWGTIDKMADDALIMVGIVMLIVRQFSWRSAELHRMLRLPVIIIATGIAYLAVELWGGSRWVPGDWFIVAELGLVALTGTAMGYVTHFRITQNRLQYKLTAAGLWLWLVFLAIRIGSFYLAVALGANLADATGLILLSFGVNRLTAIVVVRRRAERLFTTAPRDVMENAT